MSALFLLIVGYLDVLVCTFRVGPFASSSGSPSEICDCLLLFWSIFVVVVVVVIVGSGVVGSNCVKRNQQFM